MRLPPPGTIAKVLVAIVGVISLLHFARPIDIGFDSICYLLQAQRMAGLDAATGWSVEPVCYYPPGYPAFLAMLLRVGVAMSLASTFANLACIALALVLLQKSAALVMNMPKAWSIWPTLATINSFVIVRAVTPILSEPLFLFAQAVSLFFLARASTQVGTRRWTDLILVLIAVLCAILTRTVGIALFAAVCWLILQRIMVLPVHLRRRVAGMSATAVVIALAGVLYFRGYYLTADLGSGYSGGVLRTMLKSLSYHFREIGEIGLNLPPSKVPTSFRPPIMAAGAVISVGAAVLLWVRRRRWTVFEAYLIGYSVIIFLWPFYDTRFWFPVIPVFAFIITDEIRTRGVLTSPRLRFAVATYFVYVLATGAVGHAVNIKRSLNPDGMVQQYSAVTGDESILAGLGRSTSPNVDSAVVRMVKAIRP